jgi:aspartate/methionine/tyrosine aminotransferase
LNMRESLRIQQVQAPIIPIVGQWIREHPGTISLGQGVVAYGPPPEALDQVNRFWDREHIHKYHPVTGIGALRKQICSKLSQDNGITCAAAHQSGPLRLCVCAGSNMAFVNTILATTDPGDEIILLKPFYFNHDMAIHIAGCKTVGVDTDAKYQPVITRIAERITDHTRAIVTVSPNNPTGVVYSEPVLRQVNALCREHGIYHIHDEAYEYFTYNGVEHFSPGSIQDSQAHTISLYSLSKAFGFASWRIGYMVFPAHLEEAILKIQDTVLICPPVISQMAAVGALQAGKAYCEEKQTEIRAARAVVSQALDEIRRFCIIPPADGAFYFLLKLDTPHSGVEIAERLIREFGVAAIPGETFGLIDGCYLRISYGPLDPDTATQGLERLVRGLKAIVKK